MCEIVLFDLAKKLKEKGYPQEPKSGVLNQYYEWDGLRNIHPLYVEAVWYESENKEYLYSAPTISQVLKWLREERKIYVGPCILADADTDADGKVINEYTYWSFSVTHIETGDMIYFEYERIDDKRFDSYEQAALAGISYCLDNLL